jgi:myo-inositol-1(or 4)-monophosphatase
MVIFYRKGRSWMLEFMENLAKQAGKITLEALADFSNREIEIKGQRDLVTATDRKVERFLTEAVRKEYPTHHIIGEEYGASGAKTGQSWLIDPIDGTVSFTQGLPGFAVSIAYLEEGRPQAGVVYGPLLGQLFSARRGEGAWLNGQRLRVSSKRALDEAVFATGFACLRAGLVENNIKHFTTIVPQIRDVRRMGSAALDLAYVAAGMVDGFWELSLSDYDVAAGIVLVEEAGGQVCDFAGGKNHPRDGIVAASPFYCEQLLIMLQQG